MVAQQMVERRVPVRQVARQLGVDESSLRYRLKRPAEAPDGRQERPSVLDGWEGRVDAVLARFDDPRLRGEPDAAALRPPFEAVGTVYDGREVFRWLESGRADLVILDLCLPGKPGREVLTELHLLYPALKLLVTFAHPGPGHWASLVQLGAHGFVSKHASWEVFQDALESVARGEVRAPTDDGGEVGESPVSDIEHQVLEALSAGLPVKAIARRLNLGHRTTELHLGRLRRLFGAGNNAELVRLSMATAYLPIEAPSSSQNRSQRSTSGGVTHSAAT